MATDWVKVSNPDGKSYFWNTKTDETTWESPPLPQLECEPDYDAYREMFSDENSNLNSRNNTDNSDSDNGMGLCEAKDDSIWQKVIDDDGDVYWWNVDTNETRWSLPGPPGSGRRLSSGSCNGLSPLQTSKSARASRRASAVADLHSKSSSYKDTSKVEKPPGHSRSASTVPFISSDAQAGKTSPVGKTRRSRSIFGKKSNNDAPKFSEDWSDRLRQLWKEKGSNKSKEKIKELVRELRIGEPYEVKHTTHVSFDAEEIKYKGLPSEWEEAQKQFGVALNATPRIQVDGYESRIPAVLVFLKRSIDDLNGFEYEGIFRIAPNGNKCSEVKSNLNAGMGHQAIADCTDPHVAANLIKQFYRELTPNLLNSLNRDNIMQMAEYNEDEEFEKGMLKIPEPNRSSFLWLLDLMAEVAKAEDINRMSPKNLAIVISPNLYRADDQAPMEALVLSQKIANLVEKFLLWKIKKNEESGPSNGEDETPVIPHDESR